jgi:hypothetical protein
MAVRVMRVPKVYAIAYVEMRVPLQHHVSNVQALSLTSRSRSRRYFPSFENSAKSNAQDESTSPPSLYFCDWSDALW